MASWRDESVMPREKKRNRAELEIYVRWYAKVEGQSILQRKNHDPVGVVVATLTRKALAYSSDEKLGCFTNGRRNKLCQSVVPEIPATKI